MNEKKLFASSYFLLFQRTSLVENRSVLVSSCYSFISIHSEGTTLHHTCVSFVILHEILECESLSRVLLDTLHDALTADGAIVRNVIVHARVWFRTENTSGVHESTLVNIHDIAITVVVDEVAPIHFVHFARKRKVVVPSETLSPVELIHVPTARTATGINESIVVNVFIAEFAKSMTACLMLDDSTSVEWIVIRAKRTKSDG